MIGRKALHGSGLFDDAMEKSQSEFKKKSGICWADRTGAPKAGRYAYVERSYEQTNLAEYNVNSKLAPVRH